MRDDKEAISLEMEETKKQEEQIIADHEAKVKEIEKTIKDLRAQYQKFLDQKIAKDDKKNQTKKTKNYHIKKKLNNFKFQMQKNKLL